MRGKVCESCGEDPILEGRYQLNGVIGEGAAATLYRAADLRGASFVAVKERHPTGRVDAQAEALFLREAAVLRQLRHPRIPDYVDSFASGVGRARRHYLVQEFVEGIALDAELDTRRFAEHEVLSVIRELAEILDYLHGLSPPVIHRDIKPGNVMRRADGALMLVDFGSVKDAVSGTFGGQTVAGTFGFMAPEQFRGDASPASDIYGLGALAVTLLSREDPGVLHDRTGQFRWQDAVEASDHMRSLLAAMLAEEPHDRPRAHEIVRWKEPAETVVHAGHGLAALAERGRQRAGRERSAQERERQRTVAKVDADAEFRLRSGLVGPAAAVVFRWQRTIAVASTVVGMLGGVAVIAAASSWIAERIEVTGAWETVAGTVASIALIGAIALGLFGVIWLEDKVLRAFARLASGAEQRSLEALPVPIELGAYLDSLRDFRHSGRIQLTLRTRAPLDKDEVQVVRDALKGTGLDGSAYPKPGVLMLKSPKMDLTTLHGKSLNHAVSHHHRLHAWTRKALSQIVLPARERLGITAIRPEVVD